MLKFKVALIISLSVISAGCAKDKDDLSDFKPTFHPSEPRGHNSGAKGPLTGLVQEAFTAPWAENCDKNEAAKRLEIAEALDRHADVIAITAKSTPAKQVAHVQIGPTYFQNSAREPTEMKWQTEKESWSAIYQLYHQIKDQNADTAQWQMLNRRARGIVADDSDRLFTSEAFIFGYDDEKRLSQMIQKLETCAKTNCLQLNLKTSEEKFLASSPLLRGYLESWAQASDSTDRAQKRDKFISILKRNYESSYGFYHNENVSRPSPKRISLRLNAGVFAGAEEAVSQAITSIWSSAKIRLEIHWVDLNIFPGVYAFALGASTGERAYTDRTKKLVMLYPGGGITVIAHEIGHALGLSDEYYTLWDENKCEYELQIDEGNLMSIHQTGSVTPKAWKTLAEKYPVQ